MARSRYVILESDKPHFLTCTVVEWLPVFTRPDAVQILLDSWAHQRKNDGLRLFGYVILENHLHYVAQAPRLGKCLSHFKSFTAARVIALLEARHAERLLDRLRFVKRGYVDRPEHWRYSSARVYLGQPGLIGVDPWH